MINKLIKEKAITLSKSSYTLNVFQDEASDGGNVYIAMNPELDGIMAQGDNPEEAITNLNELRIEYFEHLLEFGLPVPGISTTNYVSVVTTSIHTIPNITFPGYENYFDIQRTNIKKDQIAFKVTVS